MTDLTIQNGNRTHQIDHIVAGRDRLFVLETKTWRGTIEGRAGGRLGHCAGLKTDPRSRSIIRPAKPDPCRSHRCYHPRSDHPADRHRWLPDKFAGACPDDLLGCGPVGTFRFSRPAVGSNRARLSRPGTDKICMEPDDRCQGAYQLDEKRPAISSGARFVGR